MRNMPEPMAMRVGGIKRKAAMNTARQKRAMTQIGIRLDLNKRSEISPPASVPTGPARSNMLPRKPELAVPVPSSSFIYRRPIKKQIARRLNQEVNHSEQPDHFVAQHFGHHLPRALGLQDWGVACGLITVSFSPWSCFIGGRPRSSGRLRCNKKNESKSRKGRQRARRRRSASQTFAPSPGQNRGDETTERVIGAPKPHDAPAFALGKELAHVFRERRPAAGLAQALNSKQNPHQHDCAPATHRH